MRKAFVAAPLLGSIIFLTAILFTVNINKIEIGDTSRVVNDAYHNRVVSLLEIYRTDLASVFRETVSRTIQTQLLEPGWLNFEIPLSPDDAAGGYEKVRKARCEDIVKKSLLPACPLPELTQAIKGTDKYRYGIPQWMDVASKEFRFESISFSPSNLAQSKVFLPDVNNPEQVGNYLNACNTLISKNVFDCEAFAKEGVYQCKDGAETIPGCEQGTFLIRIKILDPGIFPLLPRITGDDGFGNIIRSGAIADKDFYLPINIRIFKYDDYALRLFKRLAYGSREGSFEREREGVVEGICNGGASQCPGGKGFGTGFSNAPAARLALIRSFKDGAFSAGVAALSLQSLRSDKKEQLDFVMNTLSSDANCKNNEACKPIDRLPNDLESYFPAPVETVGSSANALKFAYYDNARLTIHLLDKHPVYRVKGSEPNDVAYLFNLKHQ